MNKNIKQAKYFLVTICLFGLFIVIFNYYHIFIKNDYEVTKQIPCDPNVDPCFVSDCETNVSDCDQTTTYKKIIAPSKFAGSSYDNFSCESGDPHCQIITCSYATIEAGEKCFQ